KNWSHQAHWPNARKPGRPAATNQRVRALLDIILVPLALDFGHIGPPSRQSDEVPGCWNDRSKREAASSRAVGKYLRVSRMGEGAESWLATNQTFLGRRLFIFDRIALARLNRRQYPQP